MEANSHKGKEKSVGHKCKALAIGLDALGYKGIYMLIIRTYKKI
jgi:hypothetical protein